MGGDIARKARRPRPRIQRFAAWVVDHATLVVAAVVLATAVFAIGALKARIDSSVGTLVDRDSPAWAYYEESRETFGSDEMDVVAVVAEDAFAAATLGKIESLTNRLLKVDGVATVDSLSTARNLRATADGEIDRSPVMEIAPTESDAIARLRATVQDNPMISGTLVSEDGRTAALYITYDSMSDAELVASGVHRRIEDVLRQHEGPERIYYSGGARLKVVAAELIRDDILRLGPISFLAVCTALLFAFRTWRGMAVPALTTGIGTIWTMGLMGFLGVPVNVVTLILPTFLMAVGNAYATHVVAFHRDAMRAGADPGEASRRAITHIGIPVLVTALTTVLGFAALLAYHISAIRTLGFFSVVGITALFVLALTFTVAVLSLLKAPRRQTRESGPGSDRLGTALDRIGRVCIHYRRSVMAGALAVTAFFAWGVRHLEIDTTYLGYFPRNHPARVASEAIDKHLGAGTAVFYVTIDGPAPDSVIELDALKRIETLQDFIERLPDVGRTTSIVDYVKLMNRTLNDNARDQHILPDSSAAVSQYLLLLDAESLDGVLSGDSSRAAILVRSDIQESAMMNDVVAKIERFASDAFPPAFSVHATGTRVVLDRTADDLASGQLGSLVTAVAVVFVVLSLQFLSPRYGLVAMAPNLIPIVAFFGVLGWCGMPLGMATAMIAAIALGIGVDEAVHLLAAFNEQVKKEGDQVSAVLGALRSVGPSLLYSTGSLLLGVLVLLGSNFVPLQQFGALTALNVVISLLVDLLVLPAILVTARFVTLWDVLSLKLGGAPHDEIPLLRGLTRSQARVAVLMGVLKTVARGEKIARQGDPGDAMFVLVNGHARIERCSNDRVAMLEELHRGAVIGEMGLVRQRPRMADVIALEDSELLVVDQRFLANLQQRYPRIGAIVFLNLTRILSDRLEATDLRLLPSVDVKGAHGAAAS